MALPARRHMIAAMQPPLGLYVVAEDDAVGRALADLPDGMAWHVRSFDTPAAFLATVPDPRGVLVLGLRLRGMSGLALQARLADRPSLSLIFVSDRATIPAVVTAMKGGAFDFLATPLRAHLLVDTVASAMDRLVERQRDRISRDRSLDRLTETEREIATLMARGLRNGHIARLTSKAENTVKVHRSRIMRKLGVEHDYHLRAMIGQGAGTAPAPNAGRLGGVMLA